MTSLPSLHHVVFCVEPDHQDAAADVWRTLGFEFAEFLLDDVSLRVLLDWTRGIEIIAPTTDDARVCAARSFLDEYGEGVYSVVVRTDGIRSAIEGAQRHGAELSYQQSPEVMAAMSSKRSCSRQCSECRSRFWRRTSLGSPF